jgi:RNA polymerase sigma factor (TIGR02999 family)
MTSPISVLINAADRGDRAAADQLFTTLYAELHRMAKRELARNALPVSLGATTLLHQAYLDFAERTGGPPFPDQARFMGYASRVMRGLIIDHVRNRHAQKRGGHFEITSFDTEGVQPQDTVNLRELTDISDALDELAKLEPALAVLVDLKFFCGFSFVEIATMQGVSERTVQRDWEKARIFLHRAIRSDLPLE